MVGKGGLGGAIALGRLDHGAFFQLRAAGTGNAAVFFRIQLQDVIDLRRLIIIGDVILLHEGADRFKINIAESHLEKNADDSEVPVIMNLHKVTVPVERIQQKQAVLAAGDADGDRIAVFDHLIVKIGLMYFSKDCFQHSARPPFAFLV